MPISASVASLLSAGLGGFLGSALSQVVQFVDRQRRGRRISAALARELREVNSDIQEKLDWLRRRIHPDELGEADSERILEVDGVLRYLGEREEFTAARPYWQVKYTEVVEAVSDEKFSRIHEMYRLVDRFEEKFKELKLTFKTNLGDKCKMATRIFHDLERIGAQLNSKVGKSTK
ncbi:MAG TPA: hypothetical protein VKZ53_12450 [Candidatus Angelobacter sp.]|nr:hypothetical protein [Candidatus Angelobacter sp.]